DRDDWNADGKHPGRINGLFDGADAQELDIERLDIPGAARPVELENADADQCTDCPQPPSAEQARPPDLNQCRRGNANDSEHGGDHCPATKAGVRQAEAIQLLWIRCSWGDVEAFKLSAAASCDGGSLNERPGAIPPDLIDCMSFAGRPVGCPICVGHGYFQRWRR